MPVSWQVSSISLEIKSVIFVIPFDRSFSKTSVVNLEQIPFRKMDMTLFSLSFQKWREMYLGQVQRITECFCGPLIRPKSIYLFISS